MYVAHHYSVEYQTPHTPTKDCINMYANIQTTCEEICIPTYSGGDGSSSNPIDITGGGGTGGTGDLDTPHNDSGNNNPIVTAPVLELEEENEENDPCAKLKNGTSSIAYKQKFKALNTSANHRANNETGFAMKEINGNDEYINLVPIGQNKLKIPSGSKNYSHVHNNLPKISSNGNSYDAMIKMLSPGDLEILVKTCQFANQDVKDGFGLMCSNQGIFAITLLEPIDLSIIYQGNDQNTYTTIWQSFITYYEIEGKKIISQENWSPRKKSEQLQLMLLNGLKKIGLNDKVALFEAKVINLDNTNINTYTLNWTRKNLSIDNKEITSTPCN